MSIDFGILLQVALLALPIALVVLLAPNLVIKNLAEVPGFSPNCITVWRTVIFYAGVDLIRSGKLLTGVGLVTFGLCLDRTDGQAARLSKYELFLFSKRRRIRNFFEELCFPGKTSVGEWLDPLADKVCLLPNLGIEICRLEGDPVMHTLAAGLFVLLLAADILGTIIRPPFTWTINSQEWLRSCRATWPGKVKTIFAMMAFSVLILGKIKGINMEDAIGITVGLLIPTVIMAWISLITKIRLVQFFGERSRFGRAAFLKIDAAVESVFK